jgi:hypothetical protein
MDGTHDNFDLASEQGLEMHTTQNGFTAAPNQALMATPSPTPSTTVMGSKFDPKLYRLAQNVRQDEISGSTRKIQTIVPVRKPSKKLFVRVHPDPEFRADRMPTIEDETTGDIYLLAANLEFPVDIENKVDSLNLAAAITTDGSLFLWHYKESTNSWSDSARIAVREASRRWIRVIPDKSSNGYILEAPMVAPAEPVWPSLSFTEILETAFGSRYIDSLRHPLIKKLRGDFNV